MGHACNDSMLRNLGDYQGQEALQRQFVAWLRQELQSLYGCRENIPYSRYREERQGCLRQIHTKEIYEHARAPISSGHYGNLVQPFNPAHRISPAQHM